MVVSVYQCSKCETIFKTKQNLQLHMHKKYPCNQGLTCERCGYITTTRFNLVRHLNRKNKCRVIDVNIDNDMLKLRLELANLKNENLQLKQSSLLNTIIF